MKTVRRMALLLVVSMTMPACGQTIEPEIHLLPAGFEGPVLIIFNQAEGAAPKYEGEARVYEIPASGVLWTQFSDQSGWSPRGYPKFYYVASDGSRTRIGHSRGSDTTAESAVDIHGERVGIAGGERCENYVVSRESELPKMWLQRERLVDSVFGAFDWTRYFEKEDSLKKARQDSLEDARMGDAPK